MKDHISICPKCGNIRFTATQVCYHDVIVDGEGSFFADRGIAEAELPTSDIYTCCKCGAEYNSLNELVKAPVLCTIEEGMKYRVGQHVTFGANRAFSGRTVVIDELIGPAGEFPGGYIVREYLSDETDEVNDACVLTEAEIVGTE